MRKNKEKSSTRPFDTLPDYLGLGMLVTNSIVKNQEQVTGNYIWENEILYKVTIGKSTCKIDEFFDGERITTSSGFESLEKTFFNHLMSQPPYQSRQFERLFHKLTDGRNINVRFASQPRFLYFPAGYLFALRQPIVNSNKSILTSIENNLAISPNDRIKLDSKKKGVILKLTRNGNVIVEQAEIVDFGCSLFHLEYSVDMLWESGIVPNQKEYRLNVIDSSETPAGNISVYLGDISRDFVTFSVVVTEGTNLDKRVVKKIFKDYSVKFLESIQK